MPQAALAANNGTTRAQRARELIQPMNSAREHQVTAATVATEEEKAMTDEEWKDIFRRYENDIVFIQKGFEKGRFDDAVADLNELMAIMLFDTKITPQVMVTAFFNIYNDLTRLHREIKVEGYTASAIHWWDKYDHGNSLFCFPLDNGTRQLCGRIVTNDAFDSFILFCIGVGTIVMALSTPQIKGTKVYDIFEFIDLLTNIIFTIEMIMKIIWLGFYMSETAYIRDPSGWNQLDCFTVLAGWLAMLPGMPNLKSFRGFRALRAVKGVRGLSYCSAVLTSLAVAMPLFADVFAVTAFLMLIFAIMCVQLFAGAQR
jgi:hypothetical protein